MFPPPINHYLMFTFQHYSCSALSHGVMSLARVHSPVSVAHLGIMPVPYLHLYSAYLSNIDDSVQLAGCGVWPGAVHQVFQTGHQLWRFIIIFLNNYSPSINHLCHPCTRPSRGQGSLWPRRPASLSSQPPQEALASPPAPLVQLKQDLISVSPQITSAGLDLDLHMTLILMVFTMIGGWSLLATHS